MLLLQPLSAILCIHLSQGHCILPRTLLIERARSDHLSIRGHVALAPQWGSALRAEYEGDDAAGLGLGRVRFCLARRLEEVVVDDDVGCVDATAILLALVAVAERLWMLVLGNGRGGEGKVYFV
jgi:hypothetical protein